MIVSGEYEIETKRVNQQNHRFIEFFQAVKRVIVYVAQ